MRSICVVIVEQRAVVHHGAYVRMSVIVGAVLIGVRIEEDAQTIELILVSEHIARPERMFDVPKGHTVAEQILTMAIDLEFDYDLPVSKRDRLLIW